jgi:DNA polymerase-3 subunit gamma/tau
MSSQVLARKWRPRNFDTLVGQQHVVKALTHALTHQRLHHAYLFTGTRGVGKTTIARILAKSLNCETGITASPCGVCAACTEIDAGRYVDYIEMDAASYRGVDDMVDLLERATYAPSSGRYKVYMIDEVHQLTNHAFNAMLKTLEEPPSHVLFILATTDPQKVPVTVLSRCLQFNLKQMPGSAIAGHLAMVLREEGIQSEEGALRLVANSARGSMRDALSLMDQAIAFCAGSVSETAVREMLGSVDSDYLYRLLEALNADDVASALAVADEMEARSLSFDEALSELAVLLHRIALLQQVPTALPEEGWDPQRPQALAAAMDAELVQLFYQIALQGRNDLPNAPDSYAGFSMTLLRMAAFRQAPVPATPSSTVTPTSFAAAPSSPAAPSPASRPAPRYTPPNRVASAPASRAPAAPAAAAPVAAAPAAPAAAKPMASITDWPSFARGLGVVGITKQLAQQSELVSFQDGLVSLRVPSGSKHLAERMYQDKLLLALQTALGAAVKLEVNIGATSGGGTALDRATEAIHQDSFVRALQEDFGATIVPSSIKPAQ